MSICFFFNDTATTEIYTLSLHDALPICELVADLRVEQLDEGRGGHRDSRTCAVAVTGRYPVTRRCPWTGREGKANLTAWGSPGACRRRSAARTSRAASGAPCGPSPREDRKSVV